MLSRVALVLCRVVSCCTHVFLLLSCCLMLCKIEVTIKTNCDLTRNSYSLLKWLMVPFLNQITKKQLTAETKLTFFIYLTISWAIFKRLYLPFVKSNAKIVFIYGYFCRFQISLVDSAKHLACISMTLTWYWKVSLSSPNFHSYKIYL